MNLDNNNMKLIPGAFIGALIVVSMYTFIIVEIFDKFSVKIRGY